MSLTVRYENMSTLPLKGEDIIQGIVFITQCQ